MNNPLAISIIGALSLSLTAFSSFANDDDYTVTEADIRQICQEETQGDDNPAQALKDCMEEYGFGDNKAEDKTEATDVKTAAVEEPVERYEEPADAYEDEIDESDDTEDGF